MTLSRTGAIDVLSDINQIHQSRTRPRDEIIDLVRGSSAFLVLISHARAFVFHDFAELTSASILTRCFYLTTSVHHQAVMVFFVLSGYFVGGSVLDSFRRNSFSWKRYSVARLVRLWIALIPALGLTFLLDTVGLNFFPEPYAGLYYDRYASGPTSHQPISLSAHSFLGNLVFLQTILVPTYGTNGPLWSLANEFWYYVLFPLGLMSVYSWGLEWKQWIYAASNFGLTVVLIWVLPTSLTELGIIWLFGVLVWVVSQRSDWMRIQQRTNSRLCFGLLFLGSLASSKTSSIFGSDYAVGFAFALWMPSLLGTWPRSGWWSRLSLGLSEISYTLYVTHFPLLFFASAVLLRGRQFEPGFVGFSCYTGLVLASLLVSSAMWWMFECNTAKIRRRIVAGK